MSVASRWLPLHMSISTSTSTCNTPIQTKPEPNLELSFIPSAIRTSAACHCRVGSRQLLGLLSIGPAIAKQLFIGKSPKSEAARSCDTTPALDLEHNTTKTFPIIYLYSSTSFIPLHLRPHVALAHSPTGARETVPPAKRFSFLATCHSRFATRYGVYPPCRTLPT